jgi:rubrerythrin
MRWRCLICGYIHDGEKPPLSCPICGAPAKMFERLAEPPPKPGTPV